MDLSFTPEELTLKHEAVSFARRALADDVIARDRTSTFSRELWERCAAFGLQGSAFPAEYGGGDADIISVMLLMEGLGQGCKDSGLLFAITGQMWTVQLPILRYGTDAQRARYLPRLCSGEWIGAHGMTEAGSGSDAFSMRTTARLDGDAYVLNGSKTFSTNAPIADVFIVFATVDRSRGFLGVTAFIVDRDTPGFQVGKEIEKMGLRTAPMAELSFDDCRVPIGNRLGQEGNGATIFGEAVEWERACNLASVVGAMERQLDTCIAYANAREQFDKPIGKFQSVANRIADMKVRLETARLIVYNAGWAKKSHGKAPVESAMAKLYVSECWQRSCMDAVQIHGGYGYTTDFEVERDLRDSVAATLYSGTSEIQRNIIARYLGL
jgi:alkylation response protein AidB-like acyl-CoA dehydrogenase